MAIITNKFLIDANPLRVCKENKVKTLRGLRLLIILSEKSNIPVQDIIQIAEEIHKSNSIHISREIFDAFCNEVKLHT